MMAIIINELKKIFRIKVLGIMIIVSIMFYFMFMLNALSPILNIHDQVERYTYLKEMTLKYGETLEEDEFEEFMKTRNEVIAEIENIMATEPLFSEAGMTTYQDYIDYKHKKDEAIENREDNIINNDDKKDKAFWSLHREQYDYIAFKLQALELMAETYINKDTSLDRLFERLLEDNDELNAERLGFLRDDNVLNNIMSYGLLEATFNYNTFLAILIIINITIAISPLVVRDKLRSIELIQKSSKTGRKLYRYQLITVILSSLIISIVCITISYLIFSRYGNLIFLKNGINSALSYIKSIYNITYLQYLLLSFFEMIIIAVGCSVGAFVLSQTSKNYIELILKAIAILFIYIYTTAMAFRNFLFTGNRIYRNTNIYFAEILLFIIMLVILYAISQALYTHKKKADVYS